MLFTLRFSGTIYHQFCPADNSENGFFAVSVHTNEAGGLTGDLLDTVLSNQGNIPLLTEPAPLEAMQLLVNSEAMENAGMFHLILSDLKSELEYGELSQLDSVWRML